MMYACCDMTDYYAITGLDQKDASDFFSDDSTCVVAAHPDNGAYASDFCEPGDTLYSGNGCHVDCDDGYAASGITRCVEGAFVEYATCEADGTENAAGVATTTPKPTPRPTAAPTPCGDGAWVSSKGGCDWVAGNADKRCGKYDDDGKLASDVCLTTCGGCVVPPSAAPTAACVDSVSFRISGKAWKDCGWVSDYPSRCAEVSDEGEPAETACAVSCGTCGGAPPTPGPTVSPTPRPVATLSKKKKKSGSANSASTDLVAVLAIFAVALVVAAAVALVRLEHATGYFSNTGGKVETDNPKPPDPSLNDFDAIELEEPRQEESEDTRLHASHFFHAAPSVVKADARKVAGDWALKVINAEIDDDKYGQTHHEQMISLKRLIRKGDADALDECVEIKEKYEGLDVDAPEIHAKAVNAMLRYHAVVAKAPAHPWNEAVTQAGTTAI